MRIITYNLHKGRSWGRGDAVAEMADALAERRPDVLFCQEVFRGSLAGPWHGQQIADRLGMEHVYGPNVFYPEGSHGNATFSAMEVLDHSNVDITDFPLERRGLLRARLVAGGRPVDTVNLHLSLTAAQRDRQWERLGGLLAESPDVPIILSGDFNDWSGRLDRRVRRDGDFHNVHWRLAGPNRRTFPARRPLFCLDRIYYRGLKLSGVEVLRGDPWDRLSDHLPVEAHFEVAG